MIGIKGIYSVYQRIRAIETRIEKIRSIGRIEPHYQRQIHTKQKKYQKTFSEFLEEALKKQSKNQQNLKSTPVKSPEKTQTANNDIESVIKTASRKFGVPEALIKAVIHQESQFNPRAVSPKGAMGLMQLMPQTAELLGVKNPFNPVENILGGTKYLADLMKRYQNNLELALAAYNAGPKAVEKFNGIPPYSETQDYVKKVIGYYRYYLNKEG